MAELNVSDAYARQQLSKGGAYQHKIGALSPGVVVVDLNRNLNLEGETLYGNVVNVWDRVGGLLETLYPLQPFLSFAGGVAFNEVDTIQTMEALRYMKGGVLDDLNYMRIMDQHLIETLAASGDKEYFAQGMKYMLDKNKAWTTDYLGPGFLKNYLYSEWGEPAGPAPKPKNS